MPGFENPAAFLLLLPVPALYILRRIGMFKSISFPLTISEWEGRTFRWTGTLRQVASGVSRFLCAAAYFFAVAALAEPVVHHQEKIYTTRGTDIMFVLDTSPSMAARDIAGRSRLEAARTAIHTLENANSGASFGLVAMASEAATVVPPTTDHKSFLTQLDSLVVGSLGDGTALGTGLSAAVYHLISSSAPRKCIVLITDGENNAGSIHPETAAELAREKNITLYALGVGTRGSVPIEYVDPATGKVHSGYYESDFDPAPLEQLAAKAGGRYFGIGSTGTLSDALSSISRSETVTQSFHLRMVDEQYYDTFILISAAAFILAWILRRFYLQEFL
jgi:Ca-activated chloride channel homolog